MSEIRFDILHNRHVIIAPKRLHRPSTFSKTELKNQTTKCPFCEGNESMTPDEIFAIRDGEPNSTGWKTRVVPNLYNALHVEQENGSKRAGFFETLNGVGAHEVLIDSTNHNKDIPKHDTIFIELWLKTLISRLDDLKKDIRLVYPSIFKNYGLNSGASQEHPHTQLLALPMMPKNELFFLRENYRYYKKHGRGILQDLVENELLAKERIIEESSEFVAFCPFASSFPFEVIIAPKSNISSLSNCNQNQISSFAQILKSSFAKLYTQLGEFDYNFYFKSAPLNSNFENEEYMQTIHKNFRFYLRIIPRVYKLGGFELANEMAINPLLPEECAKLLRGEKE